MNAPSEEEETLTDQQGRRFKKTSRKLGRGTFAQVWLGEWLNPPPPPSSPSPSTTTTKGDDDGSPFYVAIKEFFLSKQTLDKALETEIEIMKQLKHPNIVSLISVIYIRTTSAEDDDEGGSMEFDGGMTESPEDRLWVVLEFCSGGDFRNFLINKKSGQKQRLSEKWACKFLLQIIEGLKYLRSRDIVHRDLKPHNLLLSTKSRDKCIKIADFGFARIVGSEALADTMCGTPLYMAPEVLKGDEYNSKADLWSVGVILYEMLCAERPFKDVRSIVALQKTVEKDPIMFPRRVIISVECRDLLQRLLIKDPRQRIEWEDFFEHPWLKTDWENPPAPPVTRGAPKASAPITIQPITRGIVRNYTAIPPSSAPVGRSPPPPPLRASVSFSTTPGSGGEPGSSVFVHASTPHGGSEPFGGESGVGMQSTTPGANSFKKTISDVFSTSFGLLKDSLKSGY